MYFPLLNHTHFSLLLSTQSPDDLVEKCKEEGYPACGITDFTSVSGTVKFYKACKKAGIKPILGCEILTEKGTLTLLCRNLNGWKQLLKIVTLSNSIERYKEYAMMPFDELCSLLTKDLIVIDGYYNSVTANSLFTNSNYLLENDYDTLLEKVVEDPEKVVSNILGQYNKAGNIYYNVFSADSNNVPSSKVVASVLYSIDFIVERDALLEGNQTYYLTSEDAMDHRVLIATKLKTTFRKLEDKIRDKPWLHRFITSSQYGMIDTQKVQDLGLESTGYQNIYESIEDFDILSPPKFPKFCDNEDEMLTQLCRAGWTEKLDKKGKVNTEEKKQEYLARIKMELDVIKDAKLAGYFLIVQDFINFFRKQGELINVRGSAGGCLISYLIGISIIDPIEYDLLFERFFDASRKGSMPDIDADFPPDIRENVIRYIKDKYGEEHVCQIATFGRLMGRGALKEVLRVNEYCSPTEMDLITEKLPQEAAISDLLEEMDEEDRSVIRWTLENDPEALQDYCWLKDDKLEGPYAKAFEQAMRIEGCLKSQGKHAAGVVIAAEPIESFCPMVKVSRGSELQAAFEMKDLEAAGGLKYDILGVASLAKLRDTCKEWDD